MVTGNTPQLSGLFGVYLQVGDLDRTGELTTLRVESRRQMCSVAVPRAPVMVDLAAEIDLRTSHGCSCRCPAFRVPPASELPDRLAAVLDVVHLLFTTGHTAPAGQSLQRRDLAERALDLARMLRHLLPGDPAVAGLLALILLTDARRRTRATTDGRLLLLAEQDRARWDRAEINEGPALIRAALEQRAPHPLRAHGGHRRRPRRRTPVGGHRLAADHRPLRRADPDLAIPVVASTAPSPSAKPAARKPGSPPSTS
jgi:hypothetical protein